MSGKKSTNSLACILLLLLIVAFHGINNYIVLKKDTVPLNGHESANYMNSLQIYRGSLQFDPFYPPLMVLASQPLYRLFGTDYDTAVMTNMIFFAILIFSTYGIGKMIQDEKTGLLAAFTVSMFPAIFGFSRIYLPDFALTAVTALSIFLLVKTENFQNRKYSILTGIAVGLGMLTKTTFLILILSMFIITLSRISLRKEKRKEAFLNILLAIFVAIIISSFWYFPQIKDGLIQALTNSAAYAEIKLNYFWVLKDSSLGKVYFTLFIFSLPVFILSKNKAKYEILSWIIIPFIFFSSIPTKTPRYILPLLPPIALIISFASLKIASKVNKVSFFEKKINLTRFIILILLVFGITQTLFLSYSKFDQFSSMDSIERSENKGLIHAQHADWDLEWVYSMLNSSKNEPCGLNIVSVSLTPLSGTMLNYVTLNGLQVKFNTPIYCLKQDRIHCNPDEYPLIIKNADYIIIESEDWDKNLYGLAAIGQDHKKNFEIFIKEFQKQKNDFK
ncbi:MAG: glycosyltransferase family 39 protein, partial [Candidatus Omnitrophota bacterium]|nr:glycosyltransferase family 39 protein [Candidatus Omnitrophota bacterium]